RCACPDSDRGSRPAWRAPRSGGARNHRRPSHGGDAAHVLAALHAREGLQTLSDRDRPDSAVVGDRDHAEHVAQIVLSGERRPEDAEQDAVSRYLELHTVRPRDADLTPETFTAAATIR